MNKWYNWGLILLLPLLLGCGVRAVLTGPPRPAPAQSARPPLTEELVAKAWQENAFRDSLRQVALAARIDRAVVQIGQARPMAAFAPQAVIEALQQAQAAVIAASGSKPASQLQEGQGAVLKRVLEQGQQVLATVRQLDSLVRQVEALAGQVESFRTFQPVEPLPAPGLADQAPTGLAGLLLSILTGILGWWQGRKAGLKQQGISS